MNLKTKVFIVTGANSGIGKACAESLLDNEAMVVGLDLKTSSITHERYIHYSLDITDEQQVITVINEIDEKFGRVDGYVKLHKWRNNIC